MGLAKISVKRGYFVISPLPPHPCVIMSSHVIFWPTPPSPSSDDVIYEQPLIMKPAVLALYCVCTCNCFSPSLFSSSALWYVAIYFVVCQNAHCANSWGPSGEFWVLMHSQNYVLERNGNMICFHDLFFFQLRPLAGNVQIAHKLGALSLIQEGSNDLYESWKMQMVSKWAEAEHRFGNKLPRAGVEMRFLCFSLSSLLFQCKRS